MRSLPLVPPVLGLCLLGLALTGLPAAGGADVKKAGGDRTEKALFNTVDKVELHGTFYPSNLGKRAPCVMLLHKIGSDSSVDGWDSLARELQQAGYAVLSFDFRGHGASTAVGPTFWNDTSSVPLLELTRFNCQQCRTYSAGKTKDTISIKDFQTSYYPVLVNDIQAAKEFLDRKNDTGECNSSNLILIGAEDGATLGALWMESDLSLYRVTAVNPLTGGPLRWDTTPEGKDVAAAVWLSISPRLGPRTAPVATWFASMMAREKKVPMGFVYGEKDTSSANFARACFNVVRPPRDAKVKLTSELPVKDSKLAGSALLGDQLDVRKWITDTYLKAIKDEETTPAWEAKELEKTSFVWVLPGSAIPIVAKTEREKTMNPIPWSRLIR